MLSALCSFGVRTPPITSQASGASGGKVMEAHQDTDEADFYPTPPQAARAEQN